MDLKELKSSNLAQAGYDPQTQTLHVKFKSGGHYSYPNVSSLMYDAFLAAPSHGKWLNQHLIAYPERHPHTKHEHKETK